MTNRKNYNSILFLTVYLGLVLVGATPQVLAHAATTRIFDVQFEIEREDDPDNPDSKEINDFLALEPEKAIAEFIEELREIKKSGKSVSNRHIQINCGHYWSKDDSGSTIAYNGKESNISESILHLWKRYEKFFGEVKEDNLPSFYKSLDEYGKVEFSQKHSFRKRNLEIQIQFSHGSAEQAKNFSENLNKAFANKVLQAKDLIPKITYEQTKAFSSERYVTVVTRLPRASIDSLLK